ncbi:MAG: lipocalin-like domain-containing protein [Candidatus Binatia bacterium]
MPQNRWTVLWLLSVFFLASAFTYQVALPGRSISFPRDHFSHPNFKTEWWYYTGHLESETGKTYGYQVTFFRFGLRDRQTEEKKVPPLFTELYMAHFALSDLQEKKFSYRERVNRGYKKKAGASVHRFLVWNEDWKIEGKGKSHVIEVKDPDYVLRLQLTSLKPPVLHGKEGLSQKGAGEGKASYYYSFTRLQSEGELEIGGRKQKVHGISWMDHEFGSNQLREDQVGWDWFSIQLDNETEIMLYLIRRKDGSPDPYSSGTLVYKNGTTRHLALSDFRIKTLRRWKSPKSGGDYPMQWKVTIPREKISLEVIPFFPGQELDTRKSTKITYWEGSVQIRGTYRAHRVGGLGYVEMTGYVGRLKI